MKVRKAQCLRAWQLHVRHSCTPERAGQRAGAVRPALRTGGRIAFRALQGRECRGLDEARARVRTGTWRDGRTDLGGMRPTRKVPRFARGEFARAGWRNTSPWVPFVACMRGVQMTTCSNRTYATCARPNRTPTRHGQCAGAARPVTRARERGRQQALRPGERAAGDVPTRGRTWRDGPTDAPTRAGVDFTGQDPRFVQGGFATAGRRNIMGPMCQKIVDGLLKLVTCERRRF
jgi:hypothetical protein